MKKYESLLGTRFGTFTLKEAKREYGQMSKRSKQVPSQIIYTCVCDCGREKKISYGTVTQLKIPPRCLCGGKAE